MDYRTEPLVFVDKYEDTVRTRAITDSVFIEIEHTSDSDTPQLDVDLTLDQAEKFAHGILGAVAGAREAGYR